MVASILIVDENTEVLKSVMNVLSKRGFEFVDPSNSDFSLNIAKTKSSDIIHIDIVTSTAAHRLLTFVKVESKSKSKFILVTVVSKEKPNLISTGKLGRKATTISAFTKKLDKILAK